MRADVIIIIIIVGNRVLCLDIFLKHHNIIQTTSQYNMSFIGHQMQVDIEFFLN